MADDSGAPPLPRRVPGATVSPRTPVRVERPDIPEDLRQRLLTAIADELQRDEAAARRKAAGEPHRYGITPVQAAPGPAATSAAEAQAAQAGTLPGAGPEPVAALGHGNLQPPAPDPAAHQAVASGLADLEAPAPDQAGHRAPAPDQAGHRAPSPDEADLQGPAADQADPQPAVPLPRRNPGTNGAPPPPAHVRRAFLPSSLLGRWPGSDDYARPLPRITAFRVGSPAAPDGAYRAEDPVAAPTLPAGAPPLVPAEPGSAPSSPGEVGAAPSSAARKEEQSARRYRVAGLLIAVFALAVAAAVALLLSGRTGTAGKGQGGLGAPSAGAGERHLAATWVAGQVSRTAVVACDPVMCRALAACGVPSRVPYPLGHETTSPLSSEIIVATAQVRARYGTLLR